jgi:cbb3-type cytochrome oxidase cytochrome c subunit
VGFAVYKAIWNNQYTKSYPYTYWQNYYGNMAADLATSNETKEAALGDRNKGVVQFTLQQYPFFRPDGTNQQRVDRCQSCHMGLENPSMTAENIIKEVDHKSVPTADIPAYLSTHTETLKLIYVLGAHPGKSAGVIKSPLLDWTVATNSSVTPEDAANQAYNKDLMSRHPFATFGCTTCHYGDGRELVEDNAHGHNEFWLAQLLPSKYQQAACAQCHTQYNTKTFEPTYNLHASLLEVVQSAAGDKYKDATNLTSDADVPAFLAKHPELQPVVTNAQKQLADLSVMTKGENLFHQNACWGCHKIEGFSKGNVGPELTSEGSITTTTAIARQLWDPRYKVNGCVMPYFFSRKVVEVPVDPKNQYGPKKRMVQDAFGNLQPLSSIAVEPIEDEETRDGLAFRQYIPDASQDTNVTELVTFVYSQTGLNYSQSLSARAQRLTDYDSAQPPTVPVTVAEGKTLFDTSGCYACHYRGDPNSPKNGKGGIAGPNLSWEGARHSQQWLVAHYLNPQAFVPKSVMPVFPFSDSQRAALSLYDSSAIPKGGRRVSEDQDMPTAAMTKDDIAVPQVRYMTR